MAHSKSALKRWRQNERHRERNKPVRTSARTAVKKARAAADGDPDEARAAVAEASSILDRAAKRRVDPPECGLAAQVAPDAARQPRGGAGGG